jgi:hypothetical protein
MADTPKEPQPEEGLQDAPAEHSEIDPELVKLPRAKTRVRPITALAIIGICLTLTLRLASDLSFSRLDPRPTAVESIESLSSEHENRFIEITARPDRPQALRLIPSKKKTGQLLVPVLGTQGKLWLLLQASPWNETPRTDELYQGRLTKLADLGYDEPLDAYFKTGKFPARPIALAEVRSALQSKSAQVQDAGGDRLSVDANTYVRFNEVAVNKVRILAVSTDPYKDEAGWSLALQNAGIVQGEMAAVSSTPNTWTFDVAGSLEEVTEKLRAARLFAASASPIATTREGTWSQLSLDGEDILLGKAQVGFRAEHIDLGVRPALDANAYVLNTTEEPGTYWYVMLLVLLLGGMGLLFGFGLYRRLR